MTRSENRIREKKQLWIQLIGMTLLILLFFTAKWGLIYFNSRPIDEVSLLGMSTDLSTVCGLLTEAQVLILVGLVVCFQKRGFFVSSLLCSFTVGTHLFPLLLGKEIISIIGMIMIAGAGCINVVIYQYSKRINMEKTKYHELSVYDALTGLANRRKIIEVLDELVQDKDKQPFSLVFIDLDDFKKINDFTGHDQGDQLLQQVVNYWKKVIRSEDILGRLGGDEFALIIHGTLTQKEMADYLETFRTGLKDSLQIKGKCFPVTACFGVAAFPHDGESYEELLKYADTAMYVAKSQGKDGIAFFSDEMYKQLIRTRKVEEGLDQAIARDELYLVYQPQYHCHTKRLRGFEVLLRWESAELGFVSPAEFIPVAEEKGSIITIGRWVLETACTRFMAMTNGNLQQNVLSINVSAIQFLDPQFLAHVKDIIQKTGIDPNRLEFEITESIFISSKEHIIDLLNQLSHLGIKIALDDFGTHYASLSYIQMLPLDTIKIDKSFIDAIDRPDEKVHLVTAIIDIAQKLNYQVIAEGIEKETQVHFLDQNGCDYIQGFLWGKPMKEAEITQLIEEQTDFGLTAAGGTYE